MKKNKQRRTRHHEPFYKLWYFYLISVLFFLGFRFFNFSSLGINFNNASGSLVGLFFALFSAFFISMAIHLIIDASSGKRKFKKE